MEKDIEQIIREGYASHQDTGKDQIPDDRRIDDMFADIPRSLLHQIFLRRIPRQRRQRSHLSDHIDSQDLERIDRHRQSSQRFHRQRRQDRKELSSIGSDTGNDGLLEIMEDDPSLLDRIDQCMETIVEQHYL